MTNEKTIEDFANEFFSDLNSKGKDFQLRDFILLYFNKDLTENVLISRTINSLLRLTPNRQLSQKELLNFFKNLLILNNNPAIIKENFNKKLPKTVNINRITHGLLLYFSSQEFTEEYLKNNLENFIKDLVIFNINLNKWELNTSIELNRFNGGVLYLYMIKLVMENKLKDALTLTEYYFSIFPNSVNGEDYNVTDEKQNKILHILIEFYEDYKNNKEAVPLEWAVELVIF